MAVLNWIQTRTQQYELASHRSSTLLCFCYMILCQISKEYLESSADILTESISYGYKKQTRKTSENYHSLVSSVLNNEVTDALSIPEFLLLIKTSSFEKKDYLSEYVSIESNKNFLVSTINYTKIVNLQSSDMKSTVYNTNVNIDVLGKSSNIVEDLLESSVINTSAVSENAAVGFDYNVASSFEDDSSHYQITGSLNAYPKNQIQANHSLPSFSLNISSDYVHHGYFITSSSDKWLFSTAQIYSVSIASSLPNHISNQTSLEIQSPESENTVSVTLQNTIVPTQTSLLKNSIDITGMSEQLRNFSFVFTESNMINNVNKTTFISDSCTSNFTKPLTHEFIIVFNFTFKEKEYLLQHLRNFFNDTYCFIQMTTFIAGRPTIFSWINASLGSHQCSDNNIERNWLKMVGKNGHLRKDFIDWFRPSSEISQVQKRYLTLCIEIKTLALPKEIIVVIAVIFPFSCLILLFGMYKKKNFFKHKNVEINNIFNETFALKNRMPTILLMERA